MTTINDKSGLDRNAVEALVAHWTWRLTVTDTFRRSVGDNEDAPIALACAFEAIAAATDLRDARGAMVLPDAIATGVRIALAVLCNPLGDPRQQILQHLAWLEQRVREDAARRIDGAAPDHVTVLGSTR